MGQHQLLELEPWCKPRNLPDLLADVNFVIAPVLQDLQSRERASSIVCEPWALAFLVLRVSDGPGRHVESAGLHLFNEGSNLTSHCFPPTQVHGAPAFVDRRTWNVVHDDEVAFGRLHREFIRDICLECTVNRGNWQP